MGLVSTSFKKTMQLKWLTNVFTLKRTIFLIIVVMLMIVAGLTSTFFMTWYLSTKLPAWIDNPPPSPFIGSPRPAWVKIATHRPNNKPIKIGHRGASKYAPENTLASIQSAIELGIDYVELDVRYTSDGVPIIFHDALLHRTTDGFGYVKNTSLSELQKLDAGSWFGEEFKGTQVPTLKDALELMQGRICLQWHIKSTVTKKAIDLVRAFSLDRNCLMITIPPVSGILNPEVLAAFAEHWPDAPLLIILNRADIHQLIEEYPFAVAIMVPTNQARAEIIDEAHEVGLLVIARLQQSIDNEIFYKKVLDAGVDGLFMNNFDLLDAYLEKQLQNFNAVPETQNESG